MTCLLFSVQQPAFRGGGATLPTVITPPSIAGTLTNGSTITWTPAVWSTGTATGQWHRDGVPISGQTGPTYTYVAATDDGTYLTVVEMNGAATATSNALITGEITTTYFTSFVGTDNTEINGWDGWTVDNVPRWRIKSNDLEQIQGTASRMSRAAPANDHAFAIKLVFPVTASGDVSSNRNLILRWTDNNNNLAINIQNNGYQVRQTIAGVGITLQSLTTFGRLLVTGDVVKGEIRGNYVRVFLNDVELPLSAAAGGGLGYQTTGTVPASSKVCFGGPVTAGTATFPFIVASEMTVSSLPANVIAVSAMTEQDEEAYTPGMKRLRIQANLVGTITQVQYLILDEDDNVAVDWTNISGISGATFDGETDLLDPLLLGTTITVWVRDATDINTATSRLVALSAEGPPQSLTFGLNAGAVADFVPQNIFHLFRPNTNAVPGGGDFKNIRANVLTVDEGTAFQSYDATSFGVGADGKPTVIPAGRSLDYLFAGQQFPPELYGDYDVTFTPGLTWNIGGDGGGAFILKPSTTIDVGAGTATIRIQAPTSSWSSPYINFTAYNGVPYTLPASSSDLFFKIYKQGADTSLAVNPVSIAYHAPFEGGYLRWMGAQPINRAAETGVVFNTYDFTRVVNKNSLTWTYHGVGYDALIEAALAKNMLPWINVPDMLSKDADGVGALAQYLYDTVPTNIPMVVELSNENWNFGAAFLQSSSLNDRAIAAGVTNLVQYSREVKEMITLFEAVFGVNNPRVRFVLAWQFVTLSQANLAVLLNEGNVYQKLYGVAGGPYGGNHGNFSNTTFMSAANRRMAVSNPTTFKTNWLAAHSADLISVKNSWLAFHRDLAAYEATKGLTLGHFRRMAYETNAQHWIESGTPAAFTGSITSNVLTVSAATVATLEVGDVITGGRTITSLGTGTGGTGTYNVSAGSNVTSTAMTATTSVLQTATRQAMHEMYISPEMGAIQVDFFTDLAKAGGDIVFFAGAGKRQPSNYLFGQWQISDTPFSVTDEPYASLADWLTA